MKRAARQRLILLGGVAVLLALAGWQLRHDAAQAPGVLLALDPAAVSRIALGFPGQPAAHYEKRAGHWWRSDGVPARVADAYLDGLAAIAAAPVLEWRPSGEFDPARIGLAPPQASLTLDGQALDFGAVAATGPQCYVRSGGRIALVSLRYMPRPDADTAVKAR